MISRQNIFKIFLILFFFLLFSWKSFAGTEDALIAVVNDELITMKNLRDYIHAAYVNMVTQGADKATINEIMKDLKENGLSKLIEDKLILSKANKLDLTINDKAVNQKIEDIKKRYGSEEEFLKALIDNRTNVSELKNKFLEQMKIEFIIEKEVKSKVFVNPEEVTKFYKDNQEKFKRQERVLTQSIFLSYDNKDKATVKELAQTVFHRIQNGESFETVAQEVSEAPSLGAIEKGKFLANIENVVFALKIDEISSPVETENGIYIFKVIGKTPAQVATLDEVKADIQNLLFRIKLREKMVSWIEKLKKDAYIEIK